MTSGDAQIGDYTISRFNPNQTPDAEGTFAVTSWTGTATSETLGPFALTFKVRVLDDVQMVEQLTIEWAVRNATDQFEGVTAEVLRRVSIRGLLAAIRQEALRRGIAQEWRTRDDDELLSVLRSTLTLQKQPSRKRSPRLSDEYLRAVAELRIKLNDHPRPIAEMAERLHCAPGTVTVHLHRATVQGWLGDDGRGARKRTPGSRLTEAWEREATDEITDTTGGKHDR